MIGVKKKGKMAFFKNMFFHLFIPTVLNLSISGKSLQKKM